MSIKNNTTDLQVILDGFNTIDNETNTQSNLIDQIMITLDIGDFIPVTYNLKDGITVTSIITKVRPGKTYEITFISPNGEDLAYDISYYGSGNSGVGQTDVIQSGTTITINSYNLTTSISIMATTDTSYADSID